MQPVFDPLLGKIRQKDEMEGKPFNPAGTYPDLTVGGLIARESDAIIDLRTSFIFRSAGGNESISTGAAKLTSIFGNVINGVPCTPTQFKSIGFNAFNPANVLNKTIAADGTITTSDDHKMAYIHVIAGQTGSGRNNGYIISSKDSAAITVNRVAFVTANPTSTESATVLTATSIDATRSAYIPPQEGWLLIDCNSSQLADMCVHLAWSYNPQNWLAYNESIIELPTVHSWGMGKAGDKMDEIDFLEQTITKRVGRTLLSDLEWTENRQAGESTYDDSSLATEYGEILAVTSDSITVGTTTFSRDSEHDTASAYAWTNDDVTIFTAHEEPTAPIYTYTTEDLQSSIKASTINLGCYGLTSGYFFVVSADSKLTLNTGSTQVDPSTYTSIYLYYELTNEILESAQLDPIYQVDDFGTEEFIGTSVAPTYATFFYLPNLYDSIRETIYVERADHSTTIDFGEVRLVFNKRNMVKDMTIKDVTCDNVATLKIYINNTLKTTLNSVTDGTETTVNIDVEIGDKVTFEITRQTELSDAQVNYSYSY